MSANSFLSELIDDRSWKNVLLRLKHHPNEASENVARGGFDNSLPLHEACRLQPPSEVVEALIAANETAVSTTGMRSFLPIHFAAKSNSVEAAVTLLDSFPDGVRKRCDKGQLPIHLGCQWGASPELVDRLLMMYPESIRVRDNAGKLPMDYAEEMKATMITKSSIIAVLECGPAYCAVSEAVKVGMKQQFDAEIEAITKTHEKEMREQEELRVTEYIALQKNHAEEFSDLEERRVEEFTQLEEGRIEEFLELQNSHGEDIAEMVQNHLKQVEEMEEKIMKAEQEHTGIINELQKSHRKDMAEMEQNHLKEVEKLEEKITRAEKERTERINELQKSHGEDIAEMEQNHLEKVKEMEEKFIRAEQEHTGTIKELQQSHEEDITEMEKNHLKKVEEMGAKFIRAEQERRGRISELQKSREEDIAEMEQNHLKKVEELGAKSIRAEQEHTKRVNELRDLNRLLREKHEVLRLKNETNENDLAEANTLNNELKEKVVKLEEQLHTEKAEGDEKSKKLEDALDQVQQKVLETETLTEQVRQMKKSNKENLMEVKEQGKSLIAQVAALRSEFAKKSAEKTERLKLAQGESLNLKSQIQSMKEQMKTATSEDMSSLLSSLRDHIDALEERLKRAHDQVEEEKVKNEALMEQLNEVSNNNETTRCALADARSQTEEPTAENEEKYPEMEEKEAVLHIMEEKLKKLQAHLDDVLPQIKGRDAALHDKDAELKEVQAHLDMVLPIAQALGNNLESTSAQVEEHEAALQESQNRLSDVMREILSLRAQIGSMEADMKRKDDFIHEKEAKWKKTEQQLGEVQHSFEQAKDHITLLTNQGNDLAELLQKKFDEIKEKDEALLQAAKEICEMKERANITFHNRVQRSEHASSSHDVNTSVEYHEAQGNLVLATGDLLDEGGQIEVLHTGMARIDGFYDEGSRINDCDEGNCDLAEDSASYTLAVHDGSQDFVEPNSNNKCRDERFAHNNIIKKGSSMSDESTLAVTSEEEEDGAEVGTQGSCDSGIDDREEVIDKYASMSV